MQLLVSLDAESEKLAAVAAPIGQSAVTHGGVSPLWGKHPLVSEECVMKYLPYEASLDLFAHLRKIQSRLGSKSEIQQTLQCITGLLYLHQCACVMEEVDREPIIAGLVQTICPHKANGLAELAIIPACEKTGLTVEALELSDLVKALRAELAVVYAAQADTQIIEVKQQLQALKAEGHEIQLAFDEIVLDSLCNEATNLNNQGLDHQIKALLGVGFSVQNIVDGVQQKL